MLNSSSHKVAHREFHTLTSSFSHFMHNISILGTAAKIYLNHRVILDIL